MFNYCALINLSSAEPVVNNIKGSIWYIHDSVAHSYVQTIDKLQHGLIFKSQTLPRPFLCYVNHSNSTGNEAVMEKKIFILEVGSKTFCRIPSYCFNKV